MEPKLPALLAVALLLAGCIEDRVSVEILTQIHADGTCTRRITYRVERVDKDQGGTRTAIPPEQDPLRLFRLPTGEPWRVTDDAQTGLREITVEALLPSPGAASGDFFHARSRKAAPARNSISAFADPEAAHYEYKELLSDPASPLAGARQLSKLLLQSDGRFARDVASALGDGAPREGELRKLFRDRFAEPLAREVARLTARPGYGPRERRELAAVFESLDERQQELTAAIALVPPAAGGAELDKAVDEALGRLIEPIVGQIEEAGLPLLSALDEQPIRFRARLVMPVPILRANTCVNGDTAEWEFDENDLFGRGFEMSALASAR